MKKIFAFILSIVALTSCADMLNTAPGNQISSGNMWMNENLAEQGINGLYRNFYSESISTNSVSINLSYLSGIDRMIWMGLEFQSDWKTSGCYILEDQPGYIGADWVAGLYEWEWLYTGVHRCNDAVENLYKAGMEESKYEKFLCEAKFLRAWYYYRLNITYQGVPVYLETVSNEECTKGASTADEVWEVVLDDLNYCIDNEYMLDNTISTDHGRPSKGSAYALRGMVYLWLAWDHNDDTSYYQLAANDFEMVGQCGYRLWQGNYIDFFNYANEKDAEMIFPIQYEAETGYCDYLQMMLGTRDTYQGWSYARPAFRFVSYFQNEDGSKFDYTQRIPEWNDDVFVQDPYKREVFFLRDSIFLDAGGNVLADFYDRDGNVDVEGYWDSGMRGTIQARVDRIGTDVFNKYYNPWENEDRCRSLYNNRDPRLKDIVVTPYDPYDCYYSGYNNGENAYNKELRWPYGKDNKGDNQDVYIGENPTSMFVYKKYVYNLKDDNVPQRLVCPTDWPLIRYTDVYTLLAECYVKLNRLQDAVNIVNEIRTRAWRTSDVSVPLVTVTTADEVMEAVRYERRIELCLEGENWFDEWRWGTYRESKFQNTEPYGLSSMWGEYDGYYRSPWYWKEEMYPWSCPSAEVQKNSNLKLGDGWVIG